MEFKNQSIINNLNDFKFDFKNYLIIRDSIIFKNCQNLEINIESKINKLIFIKCNNINLKCLASVSGIDVERCNQFTLNIVENSDLKVLDLFKSVALIKKTNLPHNKFILINQESKINYEL